MDWDDFRFFLTVATSTSIRASATKLKVSHSTVLRRLDRLETVFGSRLFERHAVGFQLTAAGEEVLQGVKDMEDSVQSIQRLVTGHDNALKGLVKISMPDIFAHPDLFPDIGDFQRQFPNIQLQMDLSYSVADLGKREADIAIRCTNQPPEDLVGRYVGDLQMAAYSTSDYAQSMRPHELGSKAKMIAYGNPQTWRPRHGFDHLTAMGFFDEIPLQVELAKRGLGIASLPTLVGDREPQLSQLTDPLTVAQVWVVYHTDLRYTSRVRIVRDFLLNALIKQFS